jgi:polyhydroxyalkanoate synthesis regulator phasin
MTRLDRIELRLTELEKSLHRILEKLNGFATGIELSRLSALRQTEVNDLKARIEVLEQQMKNIVLMP